MSNEPIIPDPDEGAAAAPGPSAAAPPPAAQRSRRRPRWRLAASALALAAVLLLAGLAGGLYWSASNARATAWWLARVPGLVVVEPQGALTGEFSARQVQLTLPGGGLRLRLEGVRWSGLRFTRADAPGAWVHLHLATVQARSLSIEAGAAQNQAPSPPLTHLRLPLQLSIGKALLDEMRAPGLTEPLRALQAQGLRLGGDGGRLHRVDGLQLQWGRVHAEASGQVGSSAGMAVSARLQARSVFDAPAPDSVPAASTPASAPANAKATTPAATATPALPPWRLSLQADGTLPRLALKAQLRPDAGAEAPAKTAPSSSPAASQRGDSAASRPDNNTRRNGPGPGAPVNAKPGAELDAQALLQPFEPWVLGALQLQAAHLDLSAFHRDAPRTDLGGKAELRTQGMGQPALAEVDLRNGEPGLWDAGSLPLHQLKLSASGLLQAGSRWQLQRFEADLGNSGTQAAAGRITGQGHYAPDDWALNTDWDAVRPDGLDSRAAAMRLSGPLKAQGQWPAAIPPASPSGTPAPPRRWDEMALQLQAQLQGRLTDAERPAAKDKSNANAANTAGQRDVEVAVDLQGQSLQWELKKLLATAGPARLNLQGSAQRGSVDAPWRVRAQGQLRDFDPRPWWRAGPMDGKQPQPRATTSTAAAAAPQAGRPTATTPSASNNTAPARHLLGNDPSRLQADAQLDLRWPLATELADGKPWLAALQGQASVDLQPSQLAGVAVQGQARWRQEAGGGGDNKPGEALLTLDLDGNRLRLEGDPRTLPAAVTFNIDAPQLVRLSPLWRLFGGPAAPGANAAPLAGEFKAEGSLSQLDAAGQLPAKDGAPWRSAGTASARQVRAGPWQLAQGSARWNGSLAPGAEVDAQVALQQALLPGFTLTRLNLLLQGKTDAHQLTLQAESPSQPPVWVSSLQPGGGNAPAPSAAASAAASPTVAAAAASATAPGATTAAAKPPAAAAAATATAVAASSAAPPHTQVVLDLRGGFMPNPVQGRQPVGWNGTVSQLQLRSSDPKMAPWWRSADVGIGVQWAAGEAAAAPAATERSSSRPAAAPPGRAPSSGGRAATTGSSAPTTPPAATTTTFATRVTVQAGRAELPGAALRWERIDWQAAANGQPAQIEAKAELDAFSVAPLLARLQPDFGWGGDLRIGGRLSLRSAPTFEADVVIERLGGDLTVTEDGLTQALGLTDLRFGLHARDGVWNFSQGLAGDTLGVAAGLVVARTSPTATWPAADTPIEGVVDLQVANLGTWGPWVPAGWRLSGQLRTRASIGGRFGAPEVTGRLEGSQLGVRNLVEGVAISDGDVSVSLQGDVARIERFTAKAGNGTASLSGQATLGAEPLAQLKLVAEDFQLLGRVDRRIVTSGQAQLRLDRDSIDLTGRFTVDEGLIDISKGDAPTLGDDVVVVRANSPPPAPPDTAGATAAPARQVKLDLQVDLGEKLRLLGRGLNTGLQGELRISSPNNKLAMQGTVRTRRGTYEAYGQKLRINRGQLTFTGNPSVARLDIEATRPNTDVRVGVAVTGTTVTPRVRLFSEPEMSDIDKLSWLVLGRESSGLGGADTALLQRAALALLAGEDGSKSDQLLRNLGIDELSLRQGNSTSGGDTKDTIVTLGKQVSRNLYVGYERSLSTTAGNWQVIYRLAQRFTLRAQSGSENSLDLIWTWRWQ